MNTEKNLNRFESILKFVIENKFKIILFIVSFFLIGISFRLSKSYRVNKALGNLEKIQNSQNINSQLKNIDIKELKLGDFYITTAFRPYMAINQHYDYCDLRILERILMSGVRAIYIDIFNDSLQSNANPIISCGYKDGEWKLTINKIKFEDFCETLKLICFNSAFLDNYDDPFILLLNLNTNHNINCLNKIKQILQKTLFHYLLDNNYTYSKKKIMQEPIKNFMGKLILIANDDFHNTDLEEFINYSWSDDHMNKLHFSDLNPDDLKIDVNEITDGNKFKLSLVVPDENSSSTTNYDTDYAFEHGCQLVAMNYQKNDAFLNKYLEKFKNNSFLPKPPQLITNQTEKPSIDDLIVFEKLPDEQNVPPISCPLAPEEK